MVHISQGDKTSGFVAMHMERERERERGEQQSHHGAEKEGEYNAYA